MKKEKKCKLKRCQKPFLPGHGNKKFCCDEHYDEEKLESQKEKRDPIKQLISIMTKNHERIHTIFLDGLAEVTIDILEAYGVDISLCRHLQPPAQHEGKIMLDFGAYHLIPETNFKTFKIFKNDTLCTSL